MSYLRSRSSAPDTAQAHRAELALYRRCRRGMADALRALLYRNADRWYTAALMVSGDEQSAAEAVTHTWGHLLKRLTSWRFGGGVQRRAQRILLKTLADQGDYQQAFAAVTQVMQMEPTELISMPEVLAEQLLAGVEAGAERIGAAYQVRRRVLRVGLAGLATVTATALALTVWLIMVTRQASVTQVVWGCVQQRVIAQDLPGAVGDIVSQMMFAEDEGGESLRMLQRAVLLLEEIAMAGQSVSPQTMRRLAERCRAERLSEAVYLVAERHPRQVRDSLMPVGLLLEEVEQW